LGAVTGAEVGAGAGEEEGEIVGSGCNVLTGTGTGVETGAQAVRKRVNSKKLTVILDRIRFCEVMTSPGADFFHIIGY
jgi:hypothetical protein